MKFFISILFSLSIICGTAYAQRLIDIRGLSMGSTSVSNSYDIDAFNQNPANILNQRLNKSSKVYFNFLTNIGGMTASKFLSWDFYDRYFENGIGGELTEQDKETILRDASDQPANVFASARLLSVIYNTKRSGSFGISVDERFTENLIVSRDFLDVGLFGNFSNSSYNFSGTENNTFWVRQINLTYAKNLVLKNNKTFDNFAFGVSVKPQFGLYYLETKKNDLLITTNGLNQVEGTGKAEFLYAGLTTDNEVKYSLDNAGFGFGFDAGINVRLKNISRSGFLNVGLSVTDLGYISWSKNAANYFYDGSFLVTDITNKTQVDSLKERIKGTRTPTASFTTGLPSTLRFGISYKITSRAAKDSLKKEIATIALDYIQGFSEELGGSKKPVVGIGGEYNIGVFSPRIGFGIGGLQDFVMSFGFCINAGPVIFDLGTYNIASIFEPKSTTKFSGGMNIKFKIN